jgi:hypothetical protein
METVSYLWFGDQNTFGSPEAVIVGAVVSCTVMSTVLVLDNSPSKTVRVTVVVPKGSVTVGLTPLADPSFHVQVNAMVKFGRHQ